MLLGVPMSKRWIMLTVTLFLLGTVGLTSCDDTLSNEVSVTTSSEYVDLGPTEIIKEGAYLITGASWESFVRRWANSIEHLIDNFDEAWVQRAINEKLTIEDSNGLFLSPPNQKNMWVAVLEDKMTISSTSGKVYNFSFDVDKYQGASFDSHIEFKLYNDVLSVFDKGIETQYFYNSSYAISDNALLLDGPTNIEYMSGGEGLNFVSFQWDYQTNAGIFGVGIEIKRAGQEEYIMSKIIQPYQNNFVMQFERNDFEEGINSIRFRYLGGPTIFNNPNQVLTLVDSEYVHYNVVFEKNNVSIVLAK